MLQYALIYIYKDIDIDQFRLMLKSSFKHFDLSSDKNKFELSVENENHFLFSLREIQNHLSQDYGVYSSILVVPFFHLMFEKYLDYSKNSVLTIFEVFMMNMNLNIVKNDVFNMLKYIGNNHLDTLKAYLDNNQDANSTANKMYLHKNSYAYRLKKIVEDTSFEYNDFNSLILIKFCLLFKN